MTEPTAEQVNAERERARAFLRDTFSWEESYFTKFWGCDAVTKFATALARVRIEAQEACAIEATNHHIHNGAGKDCESCRARLEVAVAIRALRGRT